MKFRDHLGLIRKDIETSKLYKFFKRRRIVYTNKKDNKQNEWIFNRVLKDKGANVFVSLYKVKNGRPIGSPIKRELIKSRIKVGANIF